MKHLLIFLVLAAAFYFWRKGKHQAQIKAQFEEQKKRAESMFGNFFKRGQSAAPVPMLPCAVCGVHVPKDQCVSGLKGSYCSNEHKAAREA